MRYVFTVRFCNPTSDFFLLAGRCHKVLHAFQTKHELSCISTSYLFWREKTVGEGIAFISSDHGALEAFSEQVFFNQMSLMNKFSCTQTAIVQEGGPEVRFNRIHEPEKYTIAEIRKRNRRRERRGIEPIEEVVPQVQVFGHFHKIRMTSKRKTKKGWVIDKFKLYIQREPVDAPVSGTFSTYGLSSSQLHTGSVPISIAALGK